MKLASRMFDLPYSSELTRNARRKRGRWIPTPWSTGKPVNTPQLQGRLEFKFPDS
jgi:hypothetical protein